MDGPVEAIILCKDQQNDKSHVNMVWIPFFNMIQDFKNWQNLYGRKNVCISLVFKYLTQ